MKNMVCLYILMLALVAALDAPAESAPLSIEARPQKYAVRPGDTFPVDYVVSWSGKADAYAVLPVNPPAVDWGEAEALGMRAHSRNARHEVYLTVGYRASTSGVFQAPSFDIRVLPVEEGAAPLAREVSADAPAIALTAPEVDVVVTRSRVAPVIAGFAVVVLVGLVFVVSRSLRRKSNAPGDGAASPEERAREMMHQARRLRLDGDFYGCYKRLVEVLQLIDCDNTTLTATLDKRVNDTGYRGVRPPDDAIEGDFKDVEQQLALAFRRSPKEN